jgi:hypothetical protein
LTPPYAPPTFVSDFDDCSEWQTHAEMRCSAWLLCAAIAVAAVAGKSPFDGSNVQALSGVSNLSAVIRAQDEASLFFIYDSADVNSLRVAPTFVKAVAPLDGFGRFYALDIRDPTVSWVLDPWNVQILPAVRGASTHRTPRAGLEAAGVARASSGTRQVIEMPVERGLSEGAVKRFLLSMQGAPPIGHIDTDAKAAKVHEKVTSPRATPSLVLVSNKPTSSQLFKAVSIALYGRCDAFDIFAGKAKAAQELFGVEKLPKLLLFDKNGEEHEYSGALTATAIVSFVETFTVDRAANALAAREREILALKEKSTGKA